MKQKRFIAVALAGLLALAFQATPVAAQPSGGALSFNPDACVAAVVATTENQKVRDAVRSLRDQTAREPCAGPSLDGIATTKVFAAVTAEIEQRWQDYGCRVNKALPACQGLEGVRLRATAMAEAKPTLAAAIAADPTGLLNGTDSIEWRREQLTFGVSPTMGVSLLKLVLRSGPARGSALEASVGPQTVWVNFERNRFANSPEADLPCDDLCAANTAHVVALFPLFKALDFVIQPAQAPIIAEGSEALKVKRERWEAYHFGGGDLRVQLPWELAINGVIFNQNRPKDDAGHYQPFPHPPNWALTVLHPSVGLALKDTKGADSSLVGVIEVLGFSRWSYNDENERKGEWGLSAIAAYQPRDNDRDWGYGVLARLPWRGINVAWTRTNLKAGKEDDQLLLSIDISQYIGGGMGDIDRLFQLKDPEK